MRVLRNRAPLPPEEIRVRSSRDRGHRYCTGPKTRDNRPAGKSHGPPRFARRPGRAEGKGARKKPCPIKKKENNGKKNILNGNLDTRKITTIINIRASVGGKRRAPRSEGDWLVGGAAARDLSISRARASPCKCLYGLDGYNRRRRRRRRRHRHRRSRVVGRTDGRVSFVCN